MPLHTNLCLLRLLCSLSVNAPWAMLGRGRLAQHYGSLAEKPIDKTQGSEEMKPRREMEQKVKLDDSHP